MEKANAAGGKTKVEVTGYGSEGSRTFLSIKLGGQFILEA